MDPEYSNFKTCKRYKLKRIISTDQATAEEEHLKIVVVEVRYLRKDGLVERMTFAGSKLLDDA
jgi:hypothetical protein